MKLTKNQLISIIQEELSSVLKESESDPEKKFWASINRLGKDIKIDPIDIELYDQHGQEEEYWDTKSGSAILDLALDGAPMKMSELEDLIGQDAINKIVDATENISPKDRWFKHHANSIALAIIYKKNHGDSKKGNMINRIADDAERYFKRMDDFD